jgi:hypothetical protein
VASFTRAKPDTQLFVSGIFEKGFPWFDIAARPTNEFFHLLSLPLSFGQNLLSVPDIIFFRPLFD